jgi:hypothetical protein
MRHRLVLPACLQQVWTLWKTEALSLNAGQILAETPPISVNGLRAARKVDIIVL